MYHEGLLYYFKSEKDNKFLGFMFLFDIKLDVPEKSEGNFFEFNMKTRLSITNQAMGSDLLRERVFQFKTQKEEERKMWVDTLQSKELYKCRIHKVFFFLIFNYFFNLFFHFFIYSFFY